MGLTPRFTALVAASILLTTAVIHSASARGDMARPGGAEGHPSAAAALGTPPAPPLRDAPRGQVSAAARLQTPQPSASAIEFFETNVRPIMAEACFQCHTERATSGLRVDSREALVKGGAPLDIGNPQD